jgi:hypothetical protein
VKPDSTSKTFRTLTQQLRDGCRRRGVDLDHGAAELILADHVNAVAARLRITDTHALRGYLTDEAVNQLAEVCARARAHHDRDVELASPMLLPVAHAATIIGAPAASCEAATTAEHRAETTTAVREAAATILRIAGAIARDQLSTMVDHLTDGSWHMPDHQQLPDARAHDLALRDRIARDRELLQ